MKSGAAIQLLLFNALLRLTLSTNVVALGKNASPQANEVLERALPTLLSRHTESVRTTYLFSHSNWWESADHQLTTLITQITLAHNISATAVIPTMVGQQGGTRSKYELIGDFYDSHVLQQVQPIVGMRDFRERKDWLLLKELSQSGALSFPKSVQEVYESELGLLSSITSAMVSFGMPHVDLENTDMYCSAIPGSVHLSKDKSVRFIFLDRVHFYHFCTEKYMPWWYDVRMHIVPRKEYLDLAKQFIASNPSPLTVVHIRDLMDHQRVRDEEEIERYARQVTDAMRRNSKISGTLYLSYAFNGRSVVRVAQLFESEFPEVKRCVDLYFCGRVVQGALQPPPSPETAAVLFGTNVGASLVEVALSMKSDHFIGNIYSPYSRNVALYRKLHGKSYDVLKGFGEMRKMWRWHL